jgi:long-chain acyl-CoA synthetase
MSIHWPVIRSLAARLLTPCVVDDSRTYRGIDILVAAQHVAERLASTSSSPTIGLLLPTSGATPIAAVAGWMLGRTVVPLNYLLKPEELQFVVDDCACDTIVTVKPMIEFLGGIDKAPRGSKLLFLEDINFKSFPEVRWPRTGVDDDDLAVLLYTSGTTGKPKGVMLTHGNLSSNIAQIRRHIAFRPDEVFLGVLPQFHSFGLTALTLLPIIAGSKAVFTARFVPSKILRLIREHRPTVLVAIPSMYNALLHSKDAAAEDFASLRYVVSGGEPLPGAVFDGFKQRFGVIINEGYGMTETSPVTNWCRPSEYRPHSVGPAMPGLEQRIVDIESGRSLPPGVDGEVRMRGPNVTRGYYNRPEETAAMFDREGFLRSGDIGRLDADGHLFITGRLKEMLIVGGENVFPREIEEVLNTHPSVKDSGVVGMHDDVRGELPLAFVELKEGADGVKVSFDEKSILTHCRAKLAGYKVPREVRVLDALPRNPTGKVMRKELKKMV